MLNEKGLAAAMRLAWKGNGYTAAIANGRIKIRAGFWGVNYEIKRLPRKCLALLVEHIGDLPDNACFKLQKDLGAQSKLLDEELAFWGEKGLLLTAEAHEMHRILPTMVELGGFWIWQDQETLTVWQIDREYSRIIDPKALSEGAVFLPGDWPGLVFHDLDDYAVVMPRRRSGESPMLERLDGFPWCGATLEKGRSNVGIGPYGKEGGA